MRLLYSRISEEMPGQLLLPYLVSQVIGSVGPGMALTAQLRTSREVLSCAILCPAAFPGNMLCGTLGRVRTVEE